MHLRSIGITNFRKFGNKNNVVEFVGAKNTSLTGENKNIATSTTLIVGKNNSGKTTITTALEKLVNEKKFLANDFNFIYLNNLLIEYSKNKFEKFPFLEFKVEVGVDFNSNRDLVTNIVPFMKIGSIQSGKGETCFQIILKYELKESIKFKENVKELISKNKDKTSLFRKYIEIVNNAEFKMNYYDSEEALIVGSKFKLGDLIEIKLIGANKVINDKSLSKTFNNIIKFRYKQDNEKGKSGAVDEQIEEINQRITENVSNDHTESINTSLGKIESNDRLKVRLSAELTFDHMMTNIIKYEYTEGEYHIPEGQFGLGYSNLMTIIGNIIEYIERYPEQECHSKINLICIEEPEAFMHSQMQELFIKYINDAIDYLVNDKNKEINSQLIITTHSSHILNSKIHTGNSFDNISYITIVDNVSNVVNLNDEVVMKEDCPAEDSGEVEEEKKEESPEEAIEKEKKRVSDLKFLKKHIKYKVSELFFSDAVVFVEGVTEETLLSYYIDHNENLKKYYISIFNINGAHGLVYLPIIKLLKVPTLIITDLDIKRTDEETKDFSQIKKLDKRVSTNSTIHKFNGKETAGLKKYFKENNLYVIFQKDSVGGYYATSFEEAFILSNYKNEILNKVLSSVKPNIYKEIIGADNNKENIKKNSYKFQKKLSSAKSDFSNEVLYEVIVSEKEEDIPKLPKYINDGFDWLQEEVSKLVTGG